MTVDKKMIAARTALVLDQPFFGSLALRLTLKADPTCKTAWVNGRNLGYNPKWIETLSHAQLTALIAHEVMHCAMGHPWRRDARAMRPWNIACDKAINEQLREAGFTLPAGALYPEGDEAGKSAEWIHGHMGQGPEGEPGRKSEPDEDGEPDDSKGSDQGEVRDAPDGPGDDGEPAPTAQDWKEHVTAAAIQAKAMGKLPAGMARAIAQAMKPKLDVRSLLLRFFQERSASDYSWTRPNARYIAQGLYLPALHDHSLGEVAVMVDTSGSVDDVALAAARTLVESVLEECDPAGTTLIFADAEVNHVERMEKGEPLTWEPQGGGGTDFRPALEHIENDGQYVCALCITDMYGTFPDAPPSYPVLWLSTSEGEVAPFGETVYVGELN